MNKTLAQNFISEKLGSEYLITEQFDEKSHQLFFFSNSNLSKKTNMTVGYGPIHFDKGSKVFTILGSGILMENYLTGENLNKYQSTLKFNNQDINVLIESVTKAGRIEAPEIMMLAQNLNIKLGDEYAQAMLTSDIDGNHLIYSSDLNTLEPLEKVLKKIGARIIRNPKLHLFIPS